MIAGCWLIVAVIFIYLFLICPRMVDKPDCSHLMGVHYAHRGLFDNESDAPENSLAAFRKAVAAGYGIELDIQLSKDSIPVVFHDADLKRMCGVNGKVWEYTLEELQNMKLANSKETIPTFETVLEAVDGQVPLIVEYKFDKIDYVLCEKGNALLETYDGPYCIESFHPYVLRWYRKNRPDVVRGQLSENFMRRNRNGKKTLAFFALSYLFTNVLTRPDFIAYYHRDAKNVSRRICRAFGALSVAWTIKSRAEYEKVKGEFDIFIFDSCRL